MFKTFVSCLLALAIYDAFKKKWNGMYRWKCDTCSFRLTDSDRERGIESAFTHIKTEHLSSFD